MGSKIIEKGNKIITEVKNKTPEGLTQESIIEIDKNQITFIVN